MPIYEYRCPECGAEFEKMQKVDDPAPECPECGVDKAEKKISLSSFQLTGTGFYATDYKD